MSRSSARLLADLLDSTGDVKLENLDNIEDAVNGTAKRQSFTATAGQTTFNVAGGFDSGYVDVYMDGVKLHTSDFADTSGTAIVLALGASENQLIDVIAYGTFTLSNLGIPDINTLQTSLDAKVDDTQVLTDVPSGALFTDTIYTKPSAEPITYITGLQTALDGKPNNAQLLTDVPSSAVFTDTVYSKPTSEPIGYVSGLQAALDGKLTPTGDGSGLTGVDSLPTQTGNTDKILTTDGSSASWVVKPEGADIGDVVLSTQSKDSTKYAVANGNYYSYAVYPEYWKKINSSYTDEEYVRTTGFSSGLEQCISYLELPNNRVLKSYWYLNYNNGNDGYYDFKVELSDDGGATFGSSTNLLSKYSSYQGQYLAGDNLRIVPNYIPDGDFVMLTTNVQSYSSDYGSPYKTGIIKLPSSGTSITTNQTDKLKKAYTPPVYLHPTSNKLFMAIEHAQHGGSNGYYAGHVRLYEYDPSTNTMTQHFEVGSGGSSGTYLYGRSNRVWYSPSTDKFYVYHRVYGSGYEAILNYRYGKSGSLYTSQENSYNDLASMQSVMASEAPDAVELGTWQNPDVDDNKYYSYSNNEVHSIESGNYVIRSIDTNAVVNSYSTYGVSSDLSAGRPYTGGMFIINTHDSTDISNIPVMLPLATQGANVKFSVPSISFSGTTTYIKTGS